MNIIRLRLLAGLLTIPLFNLHGQEKPALAPLSLSMRDAIRLALAAGGNPAVEIAAESIHAAELSRREARTGLLPQVDTTVGETNQILNLAALGLGSVHFPGFAFPKGVGPFNTIDARVHVRQDVFDWAALNRVRAGRTGIEAAKSDSDDAQDRIAAQVAKLYLSAQRASSAVSLAESLVTAAESTSKEIGNREASGQALSIDVAHARVQLAARKQSLIEARMEQTKANVILLSAMNRDLDTPLNLTDPMNFTAPDNLKPEQALATALQTRSDIAAQRKKVQQARLQDGAIQSERLPTLAGYADMGSMGTTVANSIGTYDVGISLRIPVLDGGRRNIRREETLTAIRQEELRAKQLETQVALEIRQAMMKLEMARGELELASQEIEVSQQELDHRSRRQEQGLGGPMEVSEAQTALAQATDSRNAAIYAWNDARIDLMQAMGTIRTLAQ